ncbi:MAG: hypothetical protein ABI411_07210 [Tahibacter sp.]
MKKHVGVALLIFTLTASQLLWAADELTERKNVADTAKKLLVASEFTKLDKMADDYRIRKSRTSSGLWKLSLVYAGIEGAFTKKVKSPDAAKAKSSAPSSVPETEKAASKEKDTDCHCDYPKLEARIALWEKRYPNSPAAHIAQADILIAHGWSIRGIEMAHKVPAEAWAPFHRYLSMAREHLEQFKSVSSVDPTWYEMMLTIAFAEGWKREEFDSLFNEAVSREPGNYETYFKALSYLLPMWHGDIDQVESFAEDAVKRTANQEGQSMYARIYWSAHQIHFTHLFRNTRAKWPRMKAGFEDIMARYPDSWNLNNYAFFACEANDMATAKELLSRIGKDVIVAAWEPYSTYERCTANLSTTH